MRTHGTGWPALLCPACWRLRWQYDKSRIVKHPRRHG